MARCERCLGVGIDIAFDNLGCLARVPCAECQGSGIVSCCDTAGASAIEVGSTYSLDGISFKVIAKGPSEPAVESVVKVSTEARPLTKEEADEFKRKHFKPRNALYPGSPASW